VHCIAVSRWFSPGIPVSSTYKTDRNDNWSIVESGVKHNNPNPSYQVTPSAMKKWPY
jgi:hypothetical protein